jgi:hypothetical protein
MTGRCTERTGFRHTGERPARRDGSEVTTVVMERTFAGS